MTSSSPRKSRSGPLSNLLKKLSPKLRPAATTTTSLEHARNRRGGGEEPVAVHQESSPEKPPRPCGPEGAAECAVPLRKTDAASIAPLDGSKATVGITNKTSQTSDSRRTQSSNPLITIEEIAITPRDPASIQVRRTLQPPRSLNLLSKIIVKPPDTNKLAGKMASVESIGSCSLDADATASESSSEIAGGMASSMSQRTLCSINVEMNNSIRQPSQVSSSPVKEKTEDRPKQLSYLNISCSVSGYTSYSCYNSKAREGLRSRDNSPARFGVETTKDTGGSLQNGSNRRWSSADQTNGGGGGGAGGTAEYGVFRTVSSSTTMVQSTVTGYNNGTVSTTITEDSVIYDGVDETGKQTKSLIQQRIERLYGPGFLAQGFRIHRDRKRLVEPPRNSTSTQVPVVCRATRDHPPVFRHLRKNFCDQLTGAVSTEVNETDTTKAVNENGNGLNIANHCDKVSADAPMSNGHHQESVAEPQVNGNLKGEVVLSGVEPDVMDGSAFILVMNEERIKIESLVALASNDLASGTLPEDVCGRLRAAIGKANLLLSQKFEQFRGLCKKNVNQDAAEPFPTTVSDLAGFWDMVLIQVGDIKAMFEEIHHMRNHGWIIDDKVTVTAVDGEKVKQKKHPRSITKRPPVVQSARAKEAAKAREELRKSMSEGKKALLQKADSTNGSAPIEIFLPEKRD